MLSSSRSAPGAYRSISHGVRSIISSEGLAGFYRGLIPSLFGVSHGAVQFMAYEQLKRRRARQLAGAGAGAGAGQVAELSNWDYLVLSAGSKVFAGSVTYPYQVVRARLQTYNAEKAYKSARDVVVQVWRKEGLSGFYKG